MQTKPHFTISRALFIPKLSAPPPSPWLMSTAENGPLPAGLRRIPLMVKSSSRYVQRSPFSWKPGGTSLAARGAEGAAADDAAALAGADSPNGLMTVALRMSRGCPKEVRIRRLAAESQRHFLRSNQQMIPGVAQDRRTDCQSVRILDGLQRRRHPSYRVRLSQVSMPPANSEREGQWKRRGR